MTTIFDGVGRTGLVAFLVAWAAGARAELKPGMVLNHALAKRPFWVVEGTPKDKYCTLRPPPTLP